MAEGTGPGGESMDLPPIYMPEQAHSALGPGGERLAFFYVPQLELEIKQVLAARPREFTYRWGYHPGHRIHVLLVYWPTGDGQGVQAGISIPEGPGDALLDFLQAGETDIFLTLEPLPEGLPESLPAAEVQRILAGLTVPLRGVRFQRRTA
ncbi:MAG: hypothetical protein DIU70_008870 [Bacillota bacterium]